MSDQQQSANLETFVVQIVNDAAKNRQSVDEKWRSNMRDSTPEILRSSSAGSDKSKTAGERTESWTSRTRLGATAAKIQTTCDFCDDVLYKNGDVPYLVNIMSGIGERTPGEAREPVEEQAEKLLDMRLKDCAAVRQLNADWRIRATFGESVVHVIDIGSGLNPDGSKTAVRSGVEAVPIHETFRDQENMGPLEDGEYFVRTQTRPPWRIMQDAQKAPRGVFFDLALLRSALGSQVDRNTGSSSVAMDSDPATADITSRTRTSKISEVWAWIPKQHAIDFEKSHAGCVKWFSEGADKGEPVDALAAEDGQATETAVILDDQTDEPWYSQDRVWCQIIVVNERVVGYLPAPGPLPYYRTTWQDMPGVRHGVGIADLMHDHQNSLDSLCRALDDTMKFVSRIVVAFQRGKMLNDAEDVFKSPGLAKIEINPEFGKSIDDVFQALKLPDPSPSIIAAIQAFQEMGDEQSMIQRIQQGNMPLSNNTAFELQQRLEGSGRHLGGKIRVHDEATEWALNFMLGIERKAGNLDVPETAVVKAGGFKSFTKRVTEYQSLLSMIQLALSNEEISKRLQLGWALHELALAQSLDPEKMWKSEEELQTNETAQGDGQQMAQMELVKAQLAVLQSKVGEQDAHAKQMLADAELKLSEIITRQKEAQNRRAETAHKITQDARNAGSTGMTMPGRGMPGRMQRGGAGGKPGLPAKAPDGGTIETRRNKPQQESQGQINVTSQPPAIEEPAPVPAAPSAVA